MLARLGLGTARARRAEPEPTPRRTCRAWGTACPVPKMGRAIPGMGRTRAGPGIAHLPLLSGILR